MLLVEAVPSATNDICTLDESTCSQNAACPFFALQHIICLITPCLDSSCLVLNVYCPPSTIGGDVLDHGHGCDLAHRRPRQ